MNSFEWGKHTNLKQAIVQYLELNVLMDSDSTRYSTEFRSRIEGFSRTIFIKFNVYLLINSELYGCDCKMEALVHAEYSTVIRDVIQSPILARHNLRTSDSPHLRSFAPRHCELNIC